MSDVQRSLQGQPGRMTGLALVIYRPIQFSFDRAALVAVKRTHAGGLLAAVPSEPDSSLKL